MAVRDKNMIGPRKVVADSQGLHTAVASWFTPLAVQHAFGPPGSETERLGITAVSRAGKRWRPMLTAGTYRALTGARVEDFPVDIVRLALSVECLHKASLIHDDIEDHDDTRDGIPTFHCEYGVPVALNIGDYLLGQGYRLLSAIECDESVVRNLLELTAATHRHLCIGQGEELLWSRNPGLLREDDVLQIFKLKTAPAFELAMRLSSVYGGEDEICGDVLRDFAEALGIAYQIRDDIEDRSVLEQGVATGKIRPSLLIAVVHELDNNQDNGQLRGDDIGVYRNLDVRREDVTGRAFNLFERFREKAFAAAENAPSPALRDMLTLVAMQVLGAGSGAGETPGAAMRG